MTVPLKPYCPNRDLCTAVTHVCKEVYAAFRHRVVSWQAVTPRGRADNHHHSPTNPRCMTLRQHLATSGLARAAVTHAICWAARDTTHVCPVARRRQRLLTKKKKKKKKTHTHTHTHTKQGIDGRDGSQSQGQARQQRARPAGQLRFAPGDMRPNERRCGWPQR